MKKLLVVVFVMMLSFASSLQAAKRSPFLIVGMLPHTTMMIKNNWDNERLALTKKQKQKLLKVRKDTMNGVKSIKAKVFPMEKKVASKAMAGAKPKDLLELVDKIAKLKARATRIHLRCIYKTQQILTIKQRNFLKEL